jgi:hypothetical protein
MICVMNVKLGICNICTLKRKNGARVMKELSPQDKGVRTTSTWVDSCLANRSHGQGIVVIENEPMKGRTVIISAIKEVIEVMWNVLKGRKRDFALVTTHAKLRINDRGVGKFLIYPMKGMAERTLNIHLSKAVNWPSKIKGLACKRKMQRWLWLYWLCEMQDMIDQRWLKEIVEERWLNIIVSKRNVKKG